MAVRRLRLATLCAAAMVVTLAHASSAAAQELLQNGGFEQGTSGWSGSGLSTDGCAPHGGALALSVTNLAQQDLPQPVGSGEYTLQGWLKARDAPAAAEVSIRWTNANGDALAPATKQVAATTAYATFSLIATAPAGAYGLRLRITAQGGPICLDDLSLDGPATLPPPTATLPPSTTPVNTSEPSSTPAPSSTPRPSTTAAPPTAVPSPSATFAFVNGGFEDGLRGWSRFGGTLSVVGQPVLAGEAAGRLSSTTDSTKWAYQTVLVEPSDHYEFMGHVVGNAGVARAYLRISWYASADGSGTALDTSDSTETIESPGGGFIFLTTGAVSPPPAARSARPRVVMTPIGAGATSIFFDDLWFGAVAAPPAAVPTSTPPRSQPAASIASTPLPSGGAAAERPASSTFAAPNTPESALSVAGARSNPIAIATAIPLPAGALPLRAGKDRGVPLIWLGAAASMVAVLAVSYWHARRRPE